MQTQTDFLEAAFRNMFQCNLSGLKANAAAYFIALGPEKRDPSLELLARFVGNSPPVRPVSAAFVDGPRSEVRDKETGQASIIFRVESLRSLSDNEFEFVGGYEESSRSSSGG